MPAGPNRVAAEYGITKSSAARLRGEQGRFRVMDDVARAATHTEMKRMGRTYRAALVRLWIAHGHNKTGASLKTLRVRDHGNSMEVSMGGGFAYVNYGFPPHAIPRSGRTLMHWTDKDGSQRYAMKVQSPGYRGDDVMEQAMGEIDPERGMKRIATRTFVSMDAEGMQRGRAASGAAADTFETTGDMGQAQAAYNEGME